MPSPLNARLLPVLIFLTVPLLPTSATYNVLPAPPCSGDRGTDSFFVPNSIKPFICLGGHKEIKFNLTCTSVPVTAASYKSSLAELQSNAYQAVASHSVPKYDFEHKYDTTACVPPQIGGSGDAPVSSVTRILTPTDIPPVPDNTRRRRSRMADNPVLETSPTEPCTEISIRQLADDEQSVFEKPGSPYHVLLPQGAKHFTLETWSDLLDTLAQLPGADQGGDTGGNGGPLQCRIDVFEGNGLKFGEGCITPLKGGRLMSRT
ncbi:uncharacterized protein KY384_004513 [Bacidia gigantensis]|uniref:uncharacterized protein n=1 Tax=Bacidia gigantensis TaxID=2732470 RepID=UPI001D037B65|nr:uncharacterized protein KY384_004513 [Bacidia gigantensis]KAG8531155.1 hypothetical protein KY384_004513 [Bacidia gigantensis]